MHQRKSFSLKLFFFPTNFQQLNTTQFFLSFISKKKKEEEIGDLKNSRQSRQMPPKLKMRTKQIDQHYQSKKHSNFGPFCLFGPVRSTLVYFGPLWSNLANSVNLVCFCPFGPIRFVSVYFSQFGPSDLLRSIQFIQSVRSSSVQFDLFWSIQSSLVHFRLP